MKFVVLIIYSLQILANGKNLPRDEVIRKEIIDDEIRLSIGGNLILTEKEETVNKVLMNWKQEELSLGIKDPRHYKLSRPYFDFKGGIKSSQVYKFLKIMPKAAVLHLHINAVLDPEFFLNVTYKNHLQICRGGNVKFRFSYNIPSEQCDTKWELMSDVRQSVTNLTKFDSEIQQLFTLDGEKYSNIDAVWAKFSRIFEVIYPLWSHRPVWEKYMHAMLKKFRDDNVMYAEVRSSIPDLYELDGTVHNDVFYINTTKMIVEEFAAKHRNFLGMKMILSFSRHVVPKKIEELLDQTKRLHNTFPDFIAGFDLVGYEDGGAPLLKFIHELKTAENGTKFFFHAGETNWYGASADENLIDAVLLGTKRIGHGYALEKHPVLLERVKNKSIGVEVNVISNSVLNYLHDLRNHPLAVFISQDLPVVLSSDDPGLWDAEILTTDFYVAFVGIASQHHDLRLLKKLALNSIEYSAMKDEEKKTAYTLFQYQWNKFIETFVKNLQKVKQINADTHQGKRVET